MLYRIYAASSSGKYHVLSKNTWLYHSSSSFSQILIHPLKKLFAACISGGPKELNIKYTIAKYYITLLDSEVSIVDSNFNIVTGSKAAKILPDISVLESTYITEMSLKNACEEVCFSTNFHKIQDFADISNT